jgi:hypothetical protein
MISAVPHVRVILKVIALFIVGPLVVAPAHAAGSNMPMTAGISPAPCASAIQNYAADAPTAPVTSMRRAPNVSASLPKNRDSRPTPRVNGNRVNPAEAGERPSSLPTLAQIGKSCVQVPIESFSASDFA